MDLDAELLQLLNKSIIDRDAFTLIKLGANPDILNSSGYSLLHLLIFNHKLDEAFELIDNHNVNINQNDRLGHPPLYYMLNRQYRIESIIGMIKAGASPLIRNIGGTTPAHYFIKNNFKLAMELFNDHPACISLKDSQGISPLQYMMMIRDDHDFCADDYLNMVRYGADIQTVDKEGTTLLEVIMSLNQRVKGEELVALSKVQPKDRIHFKPRIIDYFLQDGISQLIVDLRKNKLTSTELLHVAKYPQAKEHVLSWIKALPINEQELIVFESLQPESSLHQFFSIQRGWFITREHRGTLAQLHQMQQIIRKRQGEECVPVTP